MKHLLSDETIQNIKKNVKNFSFMDILSIGNGAIRPAGESYRDNLAKGIFRDNGHPVLNEFLSSTLGYLVFQEQIIEFLHRFCGYTMGEADIVRRAFSKKGNTEQYIPRIKQGFIKTMKSDYGVTEERAEVLIVDFLKVIEDASDYLFSLNHSDPYSWIGYICGYLRYYYPLEFLTTMFNINSGNMQKTEKIHDYCQKNKIHVLPAKFGYSKAQYFYNKSENSIYKGVGSVKYLNDEVGDRLYEISKDIDENITFYELLKQLTFINSRQLDILIKLGYFSKFGKTGKLLQIVAIKNMFYGKKIFKCDNMYFDTIKKFSQKSTDKQCRDVDVDALIEHLSSQIPDFDICITDIIKTQFENTGTAYTVDTTYNNRAAIVLSIDTKYTPTLSLYQVCTGKTVEVKITSKDLDSNPIKEFDMINILSTKKKQRQRKIDGKWCKVDEYYYYIEYEKY